MTRAELAARIDHAILRPDASSADVHRAATEAVQNNFASIVVGPVWLKRVAMMLENSGVAIGAVVGFPHGTNKSTLKAIEATSSVKDGATELDVVPHLANLIAGDLDAARAELMEIVRAARATRRQTIITVTIEAGLLLSLGSDRGERAIATACRAVRESGCDFAKSSTGFHPAGDGSIEAIRLMKTHGEAIQIKAAARNCDWPLAGALLDAGADRLGLFDGLKVLDEFTAGAATRP